MCLRVAGGAPVAIQGRGVSKSATKAPRAGIDGEQKRGISTILFRRSGSIGAFVADLDNWRRCGPCGEDVPRLGEVHDVNTGAEGGRGPGGRPVRPRRLRPTRAQAPRDHHDRPRGPHTHLPMIRITQRTQTPPE